MTNLDFYKTKIIYVFSYFFIKSKCDLTSKSHATISLKEVNKFRISKIYIYFLLLRGLSLGYLFYWFIYFLALLCSSLELDSMLEEENNSSDELSTTIDNSDTRAIRKQLEGLEGMYSEVCQIFHYHKIWSK